MCERYLHPHDPEYEWVRVTDLPPTARQHLHAAECKGHIIRLYLYGASVLELSRAFGVTKQRISQITAKARRTRHRRDQAGVTRGAPPGRPRKQRE